MNIHMYGIVYNRLINYLKDNSAIKLYTYNLPSGDEFYPKVIIEEISNKSISISDPHSSHGFEINIYAKDVVVENEWLTSMEVCRYIQSIMDGFMSDTMRFKRIMARPTPNVDKNIYRITMQYTAISSDLRGCFF